MTSDTRMYVDMLAESNERLYQTARKAGQLQALIELTISGRLAIEDLKARYTEITED